MSTPRPRTSTVLAAWTFVLALSLLPTVIAQEVPGQTVTAAGMRRVEERWDAETD